MYRNVLLLSLTACLFNCGCVAPPVSTYGPFRQIAQAEIPRELQKATLPDYRIEPPDVLLIDVGHNIRPPHDPLQAGDELLVRVSNTLPIDPAGDPVAAEFKRINNIYQIQANGTIDLGPEYGSVEVAGLSMTDAQAAVLRHLRDVVGLEKPQVSVSMPDVSGRQVISGEHLVRPDGSISLGVYGTLRVAGLTVQEAQHLVRNHLSAYIHNPDVRLDVAGYNSKVYYVITDGGGFGQTVDRLAYTGNETVLDAVAQVQGLSDVSSKQIWIARPAPAQCPAPQILAVDWRAITEAGVTTTNYQLFPGDRIYIKADHLISLDNFVAKLTTPVERVFGVILLGDGVVGRLDGSISGNSGFGGF